MQQTKINLGGSTNTGFTVLLELHWSWFLALRIWVSWRRINRQALRGCRGVSQQNIRRRLFGCYRRDVLQSDIESDAWLLRTLTLFIHPFMSCYLTTLAVFTVLQCRIWSRACVELFVYWIRTDSVRSGVRVLLFLKRAKGRWVRQKINFTFPIRMLLGGLRRRFDPGDS